MVWVLELTNPSESETYIHIFEAEADAYFEAVGAAVERMTDLRCDNRNACQVKEWCDEYDELIKPRDTGLMREAMATYRDWNNNHDCYDNVYNIYVYEKEIVPSSGRPAMAGRKTSSSWNVAIPAVPAKKPDVPCKVCGRNVNEDEGTCWNCGVANPAVK